MKTDEWYSIPKAQAWAGSYTPPTHPSLSKPQSDDANADAKDDGQLLNLSQGVPGDPPHPLLLAELAKTSADPRSAGYGPILGERSLREAVTREMEYVYRFSGDVARKEDGERVMKGGGADVDAIGEEGTAVPLSEPIQRDGPPTWEEVAITSGCNQAFFNTVMALCERGDKVVIPVPWVRSPPFFVVCPSPFPVRVLSSLFLAL
jgi:aspartate/methionine/tyrosine aminotransferase